MNKLYANFQKYRINHSFKKKFMKIEQNTRLYIHEFPPLSLEFSYYRDNEMLNSWPNTIFWLKMFSKLTFFSILPKMCLMLYNNFVYKFS